MRLPSTPLGAHRHPRYCAIICLGAFLTGCVEQSVVLTSDKFEGGYDVVHYGPKVRITDGQGREMSTEGMFDGSASITEIVDPATLTPEDRAATKAAAQFLFIGNGGTTPGAETFTTAYQGTAITLEVSERNLNGAPRAFRVLGNGREISFATNPDIGLGTMTVKEQGNVTMVVEVSPAGLGEGSFTGLAGAANLNSFGANQNPRSLFRSLPSMQEDMELQEGDSDIDDPACNAIALGGLGGLFTFIAAHALIGTAIWLTAAAGGGIALLGVIGVLAIILFYKWWNNEEDDWAAGSPSCQSKYGDLGPYVGDHMVGAFTRLWNKQFGS